MDLAWSSSVESLLDLEIWVVGNDHERLQSMARRIYPYCKRVYMSKDVPGVESSTKGFVGLVAPLEFLEAEPDAVERLAERGCTVIAIGQTGEATERVRAARLRVDNFMKAPVYARSVVEAVQQGYNQHYMGPYRILAITDQADPESFMPDVVQQTGRFSLSFAQTDTWPSMSFANRPEVVVVDGQMPDAQLIARSICQIAIGPQAALLVTRTGGKFAERRSYRMRPVGTRHIGGEMVLGDMASTLTQYGWRLRAHRALSGTDGYTSFRYVEQRVPEIREFGLAAREQGMEVGVACYMVTDWGFSATLDDVTMYTAIVGGVERSLGSAAKVFPVQRESGIVLVMLQAGSPFDSELRMMSNEMASSNGVRMAIGWSRSSGEHSLSEAIAEARRAMLAATAANQAVVESGGLRLLRSV